MTVDHPNRVRSDFERHVIGKRPLQKRVLVIAGHRHQRRDQRESFEHIFAIGVAGVNEEIDLETLEEVDHLERQLATSARIDVRVADHAEQERNRKLPLLRYRQQISELAEFRRHRAPAAPRRRLSR